VNEREYELATIIQWAERMGAEYLKKSQGSEWHKVAMIYRSFMDKLADYPYNDRALLFRLFNKHAAMA